MGPRRIGLLGVPSSAGARQIGQDSTPALFRRIGFLDLVGELQLDVVDYGDLPRVSYRPDRANRHSQNLPLVAAVARQVADRVATIDDDGAFPLVIGGDCTITLGVVAGLARRTPTLGLMYFDGDVDLNTPATTASGIFDGMGLAHIIGRGAPELAGIGPAMPLVPQQRIVLFGFHDSWLDSTETEALASSGIALFPRARLTGAAEVVAEEAACSLRERAERYVVHFDVDVVDHLELPVADVPHFGGVSLDDAETSLRIFLGGPGASALVLTEFNALQDPDGVASLGLARRVARCLSAARTTDLADARRSGRQRQGGQGLGAVRSCLDRQMRIGLEPM